MGFGFYVWRQYNCKQNRSKKAQDAHDDDVNCQLNQ